MSYLQALAVFIAVAEEKSFSAAAKKLLLAQPTVSFHIDGLERRLDCPLFIRSRRGAELTVYGRTLYENTRNVQDLLDRTERKIRNISKGKAGHVTIGAGTIPGEYILPRLLANFLADHPGVCLNLISDDSRSIFSLWQAGKVDLCVIGFLPSGIDNARKVWEDEIIPVISKDKMGVFPEKILPSELCRYPIVLRHGSSASRSSVDHALRNHSVLLEECRVVMQVSGNEALKAAVLAGAGIGFVSRRAVEAELNAGNLVPISIEGVSITRNFYALRSDEIELPVAELVWDFLVADHDSGDFPHQKTKPLTLPLRDAKG